MRERGLNLLRTLGTRSYHRAWLRRGVRFHYLSCVFYLLALCAFTVTESAGQAWKPVGWTPTGNALGPASRPPPPPRIAKRCVEGFVDGLWFVGDLAYGTIQIGSWAITGGNAVLPNPPVQSPAMQGFDSQCKDQGFGAATGQHFNGCVNPYEWGKGISEPVCNDGYSLFFGDECEWGSAYLAGNVASGSLTGRPIGAAVMPIARPIAGAIGGALRPRPVAQPVQPGGRIPLPMIQDPIPLPLVPSRAPTLGNTAYSQATVCDYRLHPLYLSGNYDPKSPIRVVPIENIIPGTFEGPIPHNCRYVALDNKRLIICNERGIAPSFEVVKGPVSSCVNTKKICLIDGDRFFWPGNVRSCYGQGPGNLPRPVLPTWEDLLRARLCYKANGIPFGTVEVPTIRIPRAP